MTPKQERLRKAYESKLGKKLADQLTDQQIAIISKYYNSLSDKESSEIDSQIVQGRNNTELHEMAESFIEEENDSSNITTISSNTEKVSVYKPENKFVDDKIEELDEKLEETSDAIMDAIDELLAADKKKFEDFKKQEAKRLADLKKERDQEKREEDRFRKEVDKKIEDAAIASRIKEILGRQYSLPIGPIQGPKEISEIKSGLIGTTNVLNSKQISDTYGLQKQAPIPAWTNIIKSPADDEWEGETNDLMEGKLDNLIESIKNEPSVEPKKTKKSKKSKKPLARKMLGENVKEMGLTKSINIMLENIIECRQALFDLYKIEKQRFEFRKKVDKRLTNALEARVREEEIEEGSDKKKENEFIINVKKKLKRGLLEMLAAGATALLLPVVKSFADAFKGNDDKTDPEVEDPEVEDPVIDDTVVPSGSEFGPNANKEEKPTPNTTTTTPLNPDTTTTAPLNPNSRYNPDGSRKDGKEAKDGTLPITADESPLGTFTYNSGGLIPGPRINKDIIPAMLTPGEFVMSKGAVDKFGLGTMLSMNASGGGTNRPSYTGMVPGYKQGGPVSDFGEVAVTNAARKAGFGDEELAAFLAQVSHESGNFRYAKEIWGPTPDQRGYENRSDLGNTEPGDGKKYLGRGYIQITGRGNYARYGKKIGVDLEKYPELAEQPDNAAKLAIEYWKTDVRPIVGDDWNNVFKHSRAVNYPGATHPSQINGMTDRQNKYNMYLKKIKIRPGNEVPGMMGPPSPKTKTAPMPVPGNEVPGMIGPPTPKTNFIRPSTPKPLNKPSLIDRFSGKFLNMLPMMFKPRPQNQSSNIINDLGSRPIGIAAPQQPFS